MDIQTKHQLLQLLDQSSACDEAGVCVYDQTTIDALRDVINGARIHEGSVDAAGTLVISTYSIKTMRRLYRKLFPDATKAPSLDTCNQWFDWAFALAPEISWHNLLVATAYKKGVYECDSCK
jgi:hypothetical protein